MSTRTLVFEWAVYSTDAVTVGDVSGKVRIGTVLTQICDLEIAKRTARRLYPSAGSVSLIGGFLSGDL